MEVETSDAIGRSVNDIFRAGCRIMSSKERGD